ncbi:MAG TPA: hypothetical protein VK711_11050, partial [Puia sp.]|jgi:hypothetical protein|nr:hypothetical protein [Puia sp.]
MKLVYGLLFSLLISLTVFGQGFEGEIIYQNTYKSKNPTITDDRLTSLMGSTEEYFIKGAAYKSVLNGKLLEWQLYIPSENKLYTKMSNNVSPISNDAGTNDDSVISFVLNKEVTDILGYKCDELIFTSKSGTEKYYFSSKLSIDPANYVNHKFGNWYMYVSMAKAIPLKIEVENPQFSLIYIATQVKPLKLDDSLFRLPGTRL